MNRGLMVMQAVSDRTNPVVVKELRQAVQSRLVIAILLLFLLVNVLIVCGYLTVNVDATTSERSGQELFGWLYGVLVVTCMIFVPLYAAIRLTMERNDSNIDLLFITTIAPAAIIRGKFCAAVALTALIYSACMPFLTFTYLLRGIDLPSIFFALAMAFALTSIVIMLAIFAGSVAGGLLLRIILGGGLLYVGGCMMLYAVLGGLAIAQTGFASMFVGREAWSIFGMCILVGLTAWGLLYLLAVASVSARSSNRMFPVRVFLTVCWMIFGVVAGVWSWVDASREPGLVWMITSVSLLSVMLGLGLAERENWTPRVRRHIPRGTLWRILCWPFFTGAAGAVIWCFTLSAITLLAGQAIADSLVLSTWRISAKNIPQVMLGVLLFAWCYSMTGLFVRRMIVPRSTPLLGTTIGLTLLATVGTVPLFLAFLMYGPNWQFESLPIGFVIANPFVLGRTGPDQLVVFIFLIVWAILGLAVNISWFLRQWRAFRRYEPKPVAAVESLLEEPSVAHV